MTTDIKPNMVIIKLEDSLISFPLSDDGTISQGEYFESDYVLEDYHIIFALFSEQEQSSKELHRFAYSNNDGDPTAIKTLYNNNQLQDFVNYIIKSHLR